MCDRAMVQRLLKGLAAGFLLLGSIGPALASGDVGMDREVGGFWTLYPRHSEPQVDARSRLACGDYGVFHFRHPQSRPGRFSVGRAWGPIAAPLYARRSGSSQAEAESSGQAAPCQYGSCFSLLDEVGPGQPWAAVIDWDDWHGWSVGAALLQTADVPLPAVLFPLDVSRFGSLGQGVTDLQVLEKACSIAEEVDRGGRMPPVVINMSFGRLAQPDEVAGKCSPSSLGCQLRRVLGHLYRRPGQQGAGTVLVAASGNHRQPLFPAVIKEVVAAGQLDLAAFESQGLQQPSWETPLIGKQVNALFPGYGLCLGFEFNPATSAEGQGWPAPAGSSYSAALFSGWLSGALLRGEVDDPLATDWTVSADCRRGDCDYMLSQGQRALSFNPRADQMVRNIFASAPSQGKGQQSRPCPAVSRSAATLRSQSSRPQEGLAVPDWLPSVAEVHSRRDRPTPSPYMCIPCIAVSRPKPPEEVPPTLLASSQEYGTDLLVNIEDGAPLDPGLTLESVSLLVGQLIYPLDLSAADLDLLAQGAVDSLLLAGLAHVVPEGAQPSLYYLISKDDSGEVFWSSTPILMSDE